MLPVNSDTIAGIVHGYNPWWSTGRVPKEYIPPIKREAFQSVRDATSNDEDGSRSLLTGPRRVGKTTLLYQLAADLLDSGVDPKAVFYVALDHPLIQLSSFEDLIQFYMKSVLGEPRVAYFLLDEVHGSRDWLKGVDAIIRKKNLTSHIIATGTSPESMKPKGRNRVSIARWNSLRLPTLRFREFVSIVRPRTDLRVPSFLGARPPALDVSDLLENHHTNRTLTPLFNEFLLRGGFPEIAHMQESPAIIQKHLREDVVERILYRDVGLMYGTQNLPELERLFIHIALRTGDRFNLSDLAISLGIARSTVSQYIRHMESTGLIYLVRNFQGKGTRGLRSRPQIYVVDGSLRNAVLMRGDVLLQNQAEIDTLARTVLVTHLGELTRRHDWKLHHYRERHGTRPVEVDAVLETDSGIVPIALAYRPDTGPDDIQDLYSFLAKHKCGHGYILTQGTTKKRIRETFFEDIYEVPLWTFLHGLPY